MNTVYYPTMWICMFNLLTIVNDINCANILVFAPMQYKSHFSGFQPLFKELANRGHNLTVISAFPLKTPQANYTDISIRADDNSLQGKVLSQTMHFM